MIRTVKIATSRGIKIENGNPIYFNYEHTSKATNDKLADVEFRKHCKNCIVVSRFWTEYVYEMPDDFFFENATLVSRETIDDNSDDTKTAE